jgi:hypothetical protein
MPTITVQPAEFADHTLPYPFHVDAETGLVGRQDFWNGKVYAVIGFTDTPEPGTSLTMWQDVVDAPEKVVGKYVVTTDDHNVWSTHQSPIASARTAE